MDKKIKILLLLMLLSSCNYKLFVPKKYVVENQFGYLIFLQDEVIFYPTKDTVDTRFLADRKKKEGYKVEFSTDWLDTLSTDYSYATLRSYPKKFSVIPVRITSYPGDMWRPISDKNTFSYKWENKTQTIIYETADWRQILSVSIVRENDRTRLKGLPSPDIPSHY